MNPSASNSGRSPINGGTIFWALAGTALFVAIWILLIFNLVWLGLLLLMGLGLGAAAWFIFRIEQRRRIGQTILSHLEAAIRMNLPLPGMLAAAAQSENPRARRRLLALGDELDRGRSIEEALTSAVPELPMAPIAAIGVGQRIGRLPQVFDRLARFRQSEASLSSEQRTFYRIYPILLLLVLIVVVSELMIFVLPKFRYIFADFHVGLPPAAWLMIAVGNFFAGGPGVAILILAILLFGWMLLRIFFPRSNPFPMGRRIIDQMCWRLPLIGKLIRDRELSAACEFLAQAVDSGLPMDQALRDAAEAAGNTVPRDRLQTWAGELSRGTPITQAARQSGMPKLLVGMLATAADSDGFAQVFSFLSRNYEFAFFRRREILQAIYVPVVVLVMGAAVALVALSVFQTINVLIGAIGHFRGGF